MEQDVVDNSLLNEVRQIAYDLHVYLGTGLLEKVYENGLKHRLELAGHKVETQKPLKVYDKDGTVLGDYFVDLFVDDSLIVELKATKCLIGEHLAQTMNYLKIMDRELALLINFGSYRFECRSVINGRKEHTENKGDSMPAAREGSGDTSPDTYRSI